MQICQFFASVRRQFCISISKSVRIPINARLAAVLIRPHRGVDKYRNRSIASVLQASRILSRCLRRSCRLRLLLRRAFPVGWHSKNVVSSPNGDASIPRSPPSPQISWRGYPASDADAQGSRSQNRRGDPHGKCRWQCQPPRLPHRLNAARTG